MLTVKYLQQNSLKMTKKGLLSLVVLSCYAYGQETYFEVGVNNTSYDYTYESSTNDFELDSSPGIFLRVGIGELLPNLNYGFSYHQFNSIGKLYEDTFEWNTNYVGGFIQFDYPLINNKLILTPATEVLTLFSGKQFSFGEILESTFIKKHVTHVYRKKPFLFFFAPDASHFFFFKNFV